MRRLSLSLLVIILFILVACGDKTVVTEQQKKNEGDEKAVKDEESPLDLSAPIISEEHAIDERAIINETIDRHREKLKLGFITDDYPINNIQFVYFPEKEELSYGAMYGLPSDEVGSIQYNYGHEYEEDIFDDLINEINDPKQLDHESMEVAYYGEYDDEVEPNFTLYGYEDDKLYDIYGGLALEGYSFELMEAMVMR